MSKKETYGLCYLFLSFDCANTTDHEIVLVVGSYALDFI